MLNSNGRLAALEVIILRYNDGMRRAWIFTRLGHLELHSVRWRLEGA